MKKTNIRAMFGDVFVKCLIQIGTKGYEVVTGNLFFSNQITSKLDYLYFLSAK
jgi:hypothetical protein